MGYFRVGIQFIDYNEEYNFTSTVLELQWYKIVNEPPIM